MTATLERTITIDRLLAQRADAKLRQYGWTMDDAIARTLIAIVTIPGAPEKAFATSVPSNACRNLGALRGQIRISPDFDDTSDELSNLFENSST